MKKRYISIMEWLDDEKVSMILSKKQIQKIKIDYKDIFEEEISSPYIYDEYSDLPSVEIRTGLPLVEDYFVDLMDYVTDDIESEKEYIYRHAENIIKAHILCASQIILGFPLWQTNDSLDWGEQINAIAQELYSIADENEDEFFFPKFFPYYSNEYVLYPRFMIRWIIDVLHEFYDMAEDNMYYLSPEQKAEEREKTARAIRELEEKFGPKQK